jgi:hypothetical protein
VERHDRQTYDQHKDTPESRCAHEPSGSTYG